MCLVQYVASQPEGVEGCCSNKADIIYLIVSATLILGAFAGVCAMYSFAVNHNCSGQLGFLSVTLLAGFAIIVMSVLDVFGSPGLLCPAVVFLYAAWLMWSAMTSEADAECNPYGDDSDQPWYVTAIGVIISGLSLAYTSYSAASSAPALCGGDDDEEDLTSPLMAGRDSAAQDTLNKVVTGEVKTEADLEAARKKRAEEDSDDGGDSDVDGRGALDVDNSAAAAAAGKDKPWFFHLIMLSASLYMAMLLTNWGVGSTTGTSNTGAASMWIKIVTQWLTYLLYFWTLVAPLCCRNRDFS